MRSTRFKFFSAPRDMKRELRDLAAKPAVFWQKRGDTMALRLFRYAYQTTPAYRQFLKKHKVDFKNICTIEDFKNLPLTDKASYLRTFAYRDLFPKRDVSYITTISATSGSTGEPFYFPRGEEQDWQSEYVGEIFLRNQFDIEHKNTLVVVGFGMGIWIGGILTYKYFNQLAQKGYNLSVAPVGTNIELFLKTIKQFGHLYDQIILVGYPPFIKDVIDEGASHGVQWGKHRIKILTAAEGYSEQFREYLARYAHLKNALIDTINIYGTVELGTMAHETALTNLIRGHLAQNSDLRRVILPHSHDLPTLVQYHPDIVYFEEVESEVVASGLGSAMPLIRYRFSDRGGVVPFDEMIVKLKEQGIDILREARKAGITHATMRLPFVYVGERIDFALVVRGANIYPEEVKTALQHKSLERFITGKFTMVKRENKQMNEYFEVNVELKNGIKLSRSLVHMIQDIIVHTLQKINSEYSDQYQSVPKIMTPPVILWPYQNAAYFKTGLKQKWIKK